jgi:TRAP-type C4-dicarboxylate transport system substrate-binding protein
MQTLARLGTALFTAAALLFASGEAAAQKTTLRIATLAPKNSAWGKLYSMWQRAIDEKTNGNLELQIYYNAVQGNEDSMVAKMKTGQLDGGLFTAVGLAGINRDVLVIGMPGVIDSWPLLDKAREALAPELEQGFTNQGFSLLGWGDVGLVRGMSKGFAVRSPSDLKGKRPLVWRNEPMGPIIYSLIGGVVPVPLGVPEVLPALRAGTVNVISAPALGAEQLQWAPMLDHVSSQVTTCAIGGLVFRKTSLDKLPADARQTLLDIQKRASKSNIDRIRKMDEAAYQRMAKKMTVVDLTQSNRDEWQKVLRRAVEQFKQGTFTKSLVEKVLKISGKA